MQLMFVDDDQNILNGYRRMLFGRYPGWSLDYFDSAGSALAAMEERHYDIVVSDMRMPIINGVEFLEKVRDASPETVRIILSGHSDEALIIKSVTIAHQFLAKPCDEKTLTGAIERAASMSSKEFLTTGIRNFISRLTTLPSTPALYEQIVAELNKGEVSLMHVGDIVGRDVGMSAKILQMVNSAFFGLPRHIADPKQAVNMLGITTIKSLVLSAHIFNQIDPRIHAEFQTEHLWNHSLKVGLLAKAIAHAEGQETGFVEDSFISGLLHDVGRILLIINYPGRYRDLLKVAEHKQSPVQLQEISEFGSSHAEIGGYLLNLWGLPDNVVNAIAFHHEPGLANVSTFTPLTAVHAANAIVTAQDSATTPSQRASAVLDTAYLERIGKNGRRESWQSLSPVNHGEANQ